ncbi:MAG: DUF1211 domain-containing protein [Parafilimonas sp.]|nr:DUF1211 domain-containing protein [Parafilimonas sp.]
MSPPANESLHKEFELERMILFSDAVFAIAITLLILEIKFPELPENFKGINIFKFLKPTLIHFLAFVISFFFIGMSWSRHLTLCKYLKQYNNKVIFFNLLLLFFIVTFPFSISAFIENVNSNLVVAILVYVSNIFFVLLSQFLFAHYILKTNTALSISSRQDEKQYFYLRSKYSFAMIFATLIVVIAVIILSNGDKFAIAISLYALPFFAIISRRRLKRYKPKTIN